MTDVSKGKTILLAPDDYVNLFSKTNTGRASNRVVISQTCSPNSCSAKRTQSNRKISSSKIRHSTHVLKQSPKRIASSRRSSLKAVGTPTSSQQRNRRVGSASGKLSTSQLKIGTTSNVTQKQNSRQQKEEPNSEEENPTFCKFIKWLLSCCDLCGNKSEARPEQNDIKQNDKRNST